MIHIRLMFLYLKHHYIFININFINIRIVIQQKFTLSSKKNSHCHTNVHHVSFQ